MIEFFWIWIAPPAINNSFCNFQENNCFLCSRNTLRSFNLFISLQDNYGNFQDYDYYVNLLIKFALTKIERLSTKWQVFKVTHPLRHFNWGGGGRDGVALEFVIALIRAFSIFSCRILYIYMHVKRCE